ncbi:hypothetical protein [Nocardioides sp. B-3]|uniref:hypothetical protein n=1 Tax=Nocardioides sp. B-3 TaxID=2895565 RepID=UPI0021529A52|nr:hypothetical protein [Nocardioides sp. B-3]UUZ58758.1 hypothetical protein LP418_22100 [Nocardioides sp. B-3]
MEALPHRLPRAGVLPVLHRHRRRPADRRLRGQRAVDPLRRVRGARDACRQRLQRRAARLDVQRLLQAQVRQALRPDARHPADHQRHRPRRDRSGASSAVRPTPRRSCW